MTRRGDFLAALGLTGAAVGVPSAPIAFAAASASGSRAEANGPSTPAATGATPPSVAAPGAAPKAPSAAALATAQTMRRFDAKLGDDEILTIARGIDGNASFAGPALDSKAHALHNGDEPVTTFRVSP